MVGLTVIALAGSVAVALAVADRKPSGSAPAAARGGTNAMGMPYVQTPGEGTGSAEAGGVVVDGAHWELGSVPLNVAVMPTWTLRNEGTDPVAIGEPTPEVLEGCCPGALTLGTHKLAPGDSTTLSFELSMHPGMDGAHDILVHVPVSAGGAEETLTLDVTGDFQESAQALPAA